MTIAAADTPIVVRLYEPITLLFPKESTMPYCSPRSPPPAASSVQVLPRRPAEWAGSQRLTDRRCSSAAARVPTAPTPSSKRRSSIRSSRKR